MMNEHAVDRLRKIVSTLRQLPLIPLLIILTTVFMAVCAPLLTAHSPTDIHLPSRLQPPDREHILGFDTMGRDVFARLCFGARVSLIVAMLTMLVGGGVGLVFAMVGGYFGGWVDAVTMRLADAFLSFPPILIALLLAVSLGPGLSSLLIALSLSLWARFARVIHGEVLSIKERDFVAQAKVAGCSPFRIITDHIFPNVVNLFVVLVSLNIGRVIILEASLSFLGAGIPPPTPSWGQMVSEGKEFLDTAWWLSFAPGIAVVLLVLSFNLFGDWLRDFLDPELREL